MPGPASGRFADAQHQDVSVMGAVEPEAGHYRLIRCPHAAAETVVGWALDSPFSRPWVGDPDDPGAVLSGWAAVDGARCYLLLQDDVPVGYGELWHDPEEDEVELAHLMIAPERRGRGLGRSLTERLGALAAESASTVVLRIDPNNVRAHRTYLTSGFRRLPAAEEAGFNAAQPRPYVWMARPPYPMAATSDPHPLHRVHPTHNHPDDATRHGLVTDYRGAHR